ncbi:MAG: DUF3971 domain-containing protein [Alphaproteobacteria bacterium]
MIAEPDTPPRRPWLLHHRAVRHVGRGAHHVLRWFGSLAAVLILFALFGIWRVMQGPIELDWLAPYLEGAFERSGIGLKVAISGVRFGIDRNTHQLDLRAEDVHVSLPGGEPLASFPEMATSFGLGALLRGRLEPAQVVVERPVVHLVRNRNGTIAARVGAPKAAAPVLGPAMIEQLAGPRERDAPLGLLHELSIRGATVTVDDRGSGQTWRADRVDVSVERSGKGVRGDFSLAVPMGNSMPELHARYIYFAERQVLDLELSIEGVQPADIPPLIPELVQLQHVSAPVSGTLRTRIDLAHRQAQGSRLDLALGKGEVHSEWLSEGSVAIDKGEVHLVYAPERSEIQVTKLALDLGGGAELVLDGTLTGVTPELIAAPPEARPPGHLTGNLAAALSHVPAARLGELWPTVFSPGGRRWALANIHDGFLDKAAVALSLDLDPVAHTANVLNAHGSLRYHDLTINYFNGLPMIRQVAGTAEFAGKHLDFVPTSGVLKGLKLTGGTLQLTDLGDHPEWLTIDLALAGPLQDVLEVLDSKPLRYAHAIGIDPTHVGGRAETQLHFKLPLVDNLKLDAVDYTAKAAITGAALDKVVLDRGLAEGNLALDITRAGARVQGTARFDDIPSKLDATVFFHPKTGPHAVYRLGLTLDEQVQHRVGLDFAPERLKGPIAADVTYTALAANRGEATALLDLRGAAMTFPAAGWVKPPDQPGSARLVFDIDKERITGVPQIEVTAPGLDGHFAVRLSDDRQNIDQVLIRHLVAGQADLSGTVTRTAEGGWRADIHAVRADARPLIKDATSGTPSPASPPLAIDARIDRLVFGPQRELRHVTASLMRTGGIWRSGKIEGRYANGHALSLLFGGADASSLNFKSDDFGAALQLLDIADGVVGGQVTVDGRIADTDGQRALRAHLEGQNYTLVHAPVMARILALPSLTGVASMLAGTGLPFATLRGDFSYSGSRLTLDHLLGFGEALGVTANGWVDLDRDWLELQGTVAPAYALNSLFGNVPILGRLLGGGSQGLFAANYRLSGASTDPQVTVNPLGALAPGILRELFAPIVGLPAPQQEQEAVH